MAISAWINNALVVAFVPDAKSHTKDEFHRGRRFTPLESLKAEHDG